MDSRQDTPPLPSTACCGIDFPVEQGEALDVIVVRPSDESTCPSCSDFFVQFSGNSRASTIRIAINDQPIQHTDMQVMEKGCRFVQGNSLKPSTQALAFMLKYATHEKNVLCYSLYDDTNQLVAKAEALLFIWNIVNRVIVCDIDGTLTKSNARGVLDTIVLENYAHVHDGVCAFLSSLLSLDSKLRIVYLTSRPISYAQTTRRFISSLKQDSKTLPEGPLFMHPGTLSSVLLSELVTKDMHDYKSDALLRQVILPFAAAGRSHSSNNLLVAGFGNSLADSLAYEMAGISRSDIYIIDKKSRISRLDAHDGDESLIVDNVKVSSEGSLVVDQQESQATLPTEASSISLVSESRINGSPPKPPPIKSLLRNSRSYAKLVGSSYNGYNDPELLEDLRETLLRS